MNINTKMQTLLLFVRVWLESAFVLFLFDELFLEHLEIFLRVLFRHKSYNQRKLVTK